MKSPHRTPQPKRRTSAEARKGGGQKTFSSFVESPDKSWGGWSTNLFGNAIVVILAYQTMPYFTPAEGQGTLGEALEFYSWP